MRSNPYVYKSVLVDIEDDEDDEEAGETALHFITCQARSMRNTGLFGFFQLCQILILDAFVTFTIQLLAS